MRTQVESSNTDSVQLIEENRFTVFVQNRESQDFQILERWAEWFGARGIQARILWSSKGFALYREGLIDVSEEKHTAFPGFRRQVR
jgi:hypothetical protein